MDLDLAISNAVATGPSGREARRIVGAHLAVEVELRAVSVVLGVGGWGLELIEGAKTVAKDLRRYSVGTQAQRRGIRVAWLTAMPPADRPLTIFTAATLTGVDVVAVLDDLRRDGLPPVTLCTTQVTLAAEAHIRERYPDVALVTPDLGRVPASTDAGETPS